MNGTYQRQKFVLDYIQKHSQKAGIVYCSTRKQVEALYEALEDADIPVSYYHAE